MTSEFKKLIKKLHKERNIPELYKDICLGKGEEIKLRDYAIYWTEKRYSWSIVFLTNRRIILVINPGTSYSKITDFLLEEPGLIIDFSERIKYVSGFLGLQTTYCISLRFGGDSGIIVKDTNRWKEEILYLQECRRKEYEKQLLKAMPDFSEEILLDPGEEVKLRGVGLVWLNSKTYGWLYLTNKRLVIIWGGLQVPSIIRLEWIYSLTVDEGFLEIEYIDPVRKYKEWEYSAISFKPCNNDIEHWKKEIVCLRNIRLKQIEDG